MSSILNYIMYNNPMLQNLPIEGGTAVTSQFERISNPILALLLLFLFFALWWQNKQLINKDTYIKELNNQLLEHVVKNLEVIKSLQQSIQLDDGVHRTIEALLRENNNILQNIMREVTSKK